VFGSLLVVILVDPGVLILFLAWLLALFSLLFTVSAAVILASLVMWASVTFPTTSLGSELAALVSSTIGTATATEPSTIIAASPGRLVTTLGLFYGSSLSLLFVQRLLCRHIKYV
jgi:hypothetical protein